MDNNCFQTWVSLELKILWPGFHPWTPSFSWFQSILLNDWNNTFLFWISVSGTSVTSGTAIRPIGRETGHPSGIATTTASTTAMTGTATPTAGTEMTTGQWTLATLAGVYIFLARAIPRPWCFQITFFQMIRRKYRSLPGRTKWSKRSFCNTAERYLEIVTNFRLVFVWIAILTY